MPKQSNQLSLDVKLFLFVNLSCHQLQQVSVRVHIIFCLGLHLLVKRIYEFLAYLTKDVFHYGQQMKKIGRIGLGRWMEVCTKQRNKFSLT